MMSTENQTIYDFDLNTIYEFFSDTERQGPGNSVETLKALSFINNLTEKSKIADIGCGTGGQTMTLALNTPCQIIGIDSWKAFIDKFNHNFSLQNLQDRVKGIVGDMNNLSFEDKELDLIWSEGSIYNIGFERGINEWRKYLKIGGYIAITENTWFSKERPAEINEFWNKIYPEIDTVSKKVVQLEDAGYLPIATFILPETVWTDYYGMQALNIKSFLEKHKGSKTAEEFASSQRYESELYYKYKEYYGYMFFVGKRII